MDAKPARTGFVDEAQPPGRRPQDLHDLRQRLQVAPDAAVVPDLTVASVLGERNVDRFLVGIHPHEHATFRHDLPPLSVALRVTPIGGAEPTMYYVRQVSRFKI